MIELNVGQQELMAQAVFLHKMDAKFCRQLTEFAALSEQQRSTFWVVNFRNAQALGF